MKPCDVEKNIEENTDGRKRMRLWGMIPECCKNDFTEDFELENGNYYCVCCNCGKEFIGHKRRVICKECESKRGKE
ncbi:MAG: hypothetical protein EOM85_03655 [Candidatus Moranbacteria bacterium]|nr:hypothetical protein [Candidatus Moranbacteria bacterium]